MIKQLLFPGLLTNFAGQLTQQWRWLCFWRGAGTFTLVWTNSEGLRQETKACQHSPEVGSPSYGEARGAGLLGRSTDTPTGKVEEATGSRSTAGDGGGYCFVSISDSEGISLFSATTADGSRAVVLFDDQLTAEAFVLIEGLGEGWEIVEHAPSQTAILMEACILEDVKYVALNPPSQTVTACWNLRLVHIASFVESLLGAEEGA